MFDYLDVGINSNIPYTINPKATFEGCYVSTFYYDSAPFLDIPNNFETFQKFKTGKFWYNIKRTERLLQLHGNIKFVIAKSPDDIQRHIFNAFDLMSSRWKGKFSSAYILKKEGREFYFKSAIKLAKLDQFILALLYVGDECLSFSYNILIESKLHVYMHANTTKPEYSKLSTGKIFYKYLINYCCSKNISELDFMIGSEQYKLEWTNRIRPVYYIIKTKKNPLSYPIHFFKVIIWQMKFYFVRHAYTRAILKKLRLR